MNLSPPTRVLRRDFHGHTVWIGVAMGLLGYLALEWPIHNAGIGVAMFLGGQLLGMGIIRNQQIREAEQCNRADQPPADR